MSISAAERSAGLQPKIEITVPKCLEGIGSIILKPDSPDLIQGVCVQPFSVWPDDRGYFLEVARLGSGLVAGFLAEHTQISAALSYPGAIKAFHYHREQSDCWVPAKGMFQVALVDLRKESITFGSKNTFYVGSLRPWQLLIPPGVGHGYKVLSQEPGVLIYLTSRHYNPADEGRISYDDPGIGYDWELQHK